MYLKQKESVCVCVCEYNTSVRMVVCVYNTTLPSKITYPQFYPEHNRGRILVHMIKHVFNVAKMTLTHFRTNEQLLPFCLVGQNTATHWSCRLSELGWYCVSALMQSDQMWRIKKENTFGLLCLNISAAYHLLALFTSRPPWFFLCMLCGWVATCYRQ